MTDDYFDRLVDEEELAAFLEAELGPTDSYDVQRHEQGHSNETLFVEWGEQDLVIRRPPPGETAETAHDVLREYRVIDALQDTDVPVPPTVAACDDHDVIGSDFYVMERLRGHVLRDSEPEALATPERRERVGTELVDTLSAIHTLDYESVGLGEFGRPEGFMERQVDRWMMQIMWAFEVTTDDRPVPELYDVGEWLSENCPTEHPHSLVHGDYKLDNVMYSDEGDLIAVFDWEMATLGDPRSDLGWMLSYWRDEKDPEPAVSEFATTFMENQAYPTRQDLVARWEDATGLTFEHERFYRTLAVYKLAALGEMFYRRYLEGNADDPMYPKMEEGVPALAERALGIIDGEEPL
jgi:aminoglycoside phosphotransferase (APT) family kinase protein